VLFALQILNYLIFTIDEAVEKMGFGMFQLLIAMFAGLVWVSIYNGLYVCSIMPYSGKVWQKESSAHLGNHL